MRTASQSCIRMLAVTVLLALSACNGPDAPPAMEEETSAGILWQTDFSGADARADLHIEVEDAAVHLSFPEPAHALDGNVYRAEMPLFDRNGHKWRTRFHDAPGARGTHLGIGEQAEVFFRYQVWIPTTASIDQIHMKLPGIGGLPDHQGGWDTASGGNQKRDSWSLRVHTRTPGVYAGTDRPARFLDAYLYARSAGGKKVEGDVWGMSFPLTETGRPGGRALTFELGVWNTIEMHVVMNTPGTDDGLVEMWLNGVRGVSLHDVRFTGTDAVGINQILAETFYDAHNGHAHPHHVDIARMALSTRYVGAAWESRP
jgi:hypothetical protein